MGAGKRSVLHLIRWVGLGLVGLIGLAGCVGERTPPFGDISCWLENDEPLVTDAGCSPAQVTSEVWTDNGDGAWQIDECESCQVGSPDCPIPTGACLAGQWLYVCVSSNMQPGPTCVLPAPAEPVAASIWLASVCEPNDGFSADGNMTVDGRLGNQGGDSRLLAAASQTGPYVQVPVNGPPWVLTRSDVDLLAASLGVADYHALWLKMGEAGYSQNLGAMIIGRAAHMDEYCGISPAPTAEPTPEASTFQIMPAQP